MTNSRELNMKIKKETMKKELGLSIITGVGVFVIGILILALGL